MKIDKNFLLDKFHAASELLVYLHELHEKTRILSDEIFKEGVKSVKLVELRLSEIYSLLNTAKLFLSLKEELCHYEISSLLNFCESTYSELYAIARDDDHNTSWLYSEFRNFTGQYKIVDEMLSSRIEELKEMIN